MPTEGLSERFAFHPATGVTGPRHDKIRILCVSLAHELDGIMPPSREASLALTALQEAMMWANAAVAIHTPPSDAHA